MNGLIKVQNSDRKEMNGHYGRIEHVDGDKHSVLFIAEPSLAAKFGTNKFNLSLSSIALITNGEEVIGTLKLQDWSRLTDLEKSIAVKKVLMENFNQFYENFETNIIYGDGLAFLDEFVLQTLLRKQTHNHYGAKAIFEELRYHSQRKDNCALFKVNNNYTASMALLVTRLFPELSGFFEMRPNKSPRSVEAVA